MLEFVGFVSVCNGRARSEGIDRTVWMEVRAMHGLYGFCKNTPQRSQAQVVNISGDTLLRDNRRLIGNINISA